MASLKDFHQRTEWRGSWVGPAPNDSPLLLNGSQTPAAKRVGRLKGGCPGGSVVALKRALVLQQVAGADLRQLVAEADPDVEYDHPEPSRLFPDT